MNNTFFKIFVINVVIVFAITQVYANKLKTFKTLVSTTKVVTSKNEIIRLNHRPAGKITDTIIQNHENVTGIYIGVDFDKAKSPDDERYTLAKIYFGNDKKKEYYQLPDKYFLPYGLLSNYIEEPSGVLNRLNLAYDGEKYYIFIKCAGPTAYCAILVTYSSKKGLTETIIEQSDSSSAFGDSFFEIDKQILKLYYSDGYKGYFTELNESEYKTYHYVNDGDVINTGDEYVVVDEFTGLEEKGIIITHFHRNKFGHTLNPYYCLQPETYQKVDFGTSAIYNSLNTSAIFCTNNTKDMQRLKDIENRKGNDIVLCSPKLELKKKFYEELPETEILVPFLGETKDQGSTLSCQAYAYGACLQQALNSDPKLRELRKVKPNFLEQYTDISYFGLHAYKSGTRSKFDSTFKNLIETVSLRRVGDKNLNKGAIEFSFDESYFDSYFLQKIGFLFSNKNSRLDNIPTNITNYYNKKGLDPTDLNAIGNEFFKFLDKIYDGKSNIEIDKTSLELSQMLDRKIEKDYLSKLLNLKSKGQFLYQLFYGELKEYCFGDFNLVSDILLIKHIDTEHGKKIDFTDLKLAIQRQLLLGRPIVTDFYDVYNPQKKLEEQSSHSVLIVGTKKVKDKTTGRIVDLYKLQNSWGKCWEFYSNDGWIEADILLSLLVIFEGQPQLRALNRPLGSNTLMWVILTGTPEYIQWEKEQGIFHEGIILPNNNKNGVDASSLAIGLSDTSYFEGISIWRKKRNAEIKERYINFFEKLGYKYIPEESNTHYRFKDFEIYADVGGEIDIRSEKREVIEKLISQMDLNTLPIGFWESVEAVTIYKIEHVIID